jgi:hypothetical protein
MLCGIHSYLGLRHIYTRLFSPMITLHSSEKIKRFQLPSTFQWHFPLAHATRLIKFISRIRMFCLQHACNNCYGTNMFSQ